MRTIYWVILLIVVFLVGDRLGGYICRKAVANSGLRYNRLYSGSAAADMLLIGNSRGLSFYQPSIEKITNKSTLNLSYNGLAPSLVPMLVLDYLDRYPAPEMAIIDITFMDRISKSMITQFGMYTQDSEREAQLLRDSLTTDYWAGQLSHLYRYNSELFQRALFYRNRDDEDWLLDREITSASIEGIADLQPYEVYYDDNRYVYLTQTIDALHAAGTTVNLVVNPYYPAFVSKLSGIDSLITKVEQLSGMEVSDFSQAMPADQSLYGDLQHLNVKGADLYMNFLAENGFFSPASVKDK